MSSSNGTWLTRKEVEARFGTSRERVRHAERAGKLPSVRRRSEDPGAEVEYPIEELIAAGLLNLGGAADESAADPVPAAGLVGRAGPDVAGDEALRRRIREQEALIERLLSMVEAALAGAR
jgi:hypothetical protein